MHLLRNNFCLFAACLLLMSSSPQPASAREASAALKKFFATTCFGCHGPEKQEADRRFDIVLDKTIDSASLELLEEALDAINRGDMPPQEQGLRPRNDRDIASAVLNLTALLTSVEDAAASGSTVLRRLNRFEYINSIRDLLHVDTGSYDPTSNFPQDAKEEGFDNNGEALILSDLQLKRYVETAEAFVDKASCFNTSRPARKTSVFAAREFGGVTRIVKSGVSWRLLVDDKYVEIGHGAAIERHATYPKSFSRCGVPADGYYTVTVHADAISRLDHPYDKASFPVDLDQPLKLAIWIAPTPELLGKTANEGRILAKIFDLADEQPAPYSVSIWMDQGSTPFVSWINGFPSKGAIERVRKKYHPNTAAFSSFDEKGKALVGANAGRKAKAAIAASDALLISDVYDGPRVRLYSMAIDGPTYESWPPPSHRAIYGSQTDPARINVAAVIQRIATRAFRQPVTAGEVQHYVDFVNQRITEGEDLANAIQLGVAAVLASPRFLYLDEGNEETSDELAPYQLASRLSYFLWSSVPDDELLELTAKGSLATTQVLEQQVGRMLGDPRSVSFVEHFTDSWLRLHKLGSMPPDAKAFKAYYTGRLESSMRAETHRFFKHILDGNRPITEFLDCDYAFVNDALAKHYGLPPVDGEALRKVSLPADSHRGGLLGQASVLTVTANGVDTSPVVRGVWVLENILGTPPSPPPPDVEPIEPDTRGSTTIREQLNKHRHVAACANCHQKIDPLGFALEFFDPIGGYRTRYPSRSRNKPLIDGSGRLPTGESFANEQDLKKILLADKNQFARALTEKLLIYATGRSMTFRDKPEIERIVAKTQANGYGLRDLIVAVVSSTTFQKR